MPLADTLLRTRTETVMDGAARYALTGVHWDVREARATYVLEDFVSFDEWRGGR